MRNGKEEDAWVFNQGVGEKRREERSSCAARALTNAGGGIGIGVGQRRAAATAGATAAVRGKHAGGRWAARGDDAQPMGDGACGRREVHYRGDEARRAEGGVRPADGWRRAARGRRRAGGGGRPAKSGGRSRAEM
uniref:Uncharacterized protein n=1 Tax=Oryza sativa subsp. japonica TaxID=39947 RepID=Q6ZDA0_ORYSJ|nr:hypothetical protein [Oryza sativa Japonica Group]